MRLAIGLTATRIGVLRLALHLFATKGEHDGRCFRGRSSLEWHQSKPSSFNFLPNKRLYLVCSRYRLTPAIRL